MRLGFGTLACGGRIFTLCGTVVALSGRLGTLAVGRARRTLDALAALGALGTGPAGMFMLV